MVQYARGDRAWGHCDRCGFRYLLKELKDEWSGLKVCPQCWDPKPQDFPPEPRLRDPQTLKDPRPDRENVAGAGGALTLYDDDEDGLTQLNDVVIPTHDSES